MTGFPDFLEALPRRWRLVLDGLGPGSQNMAADGLLLRSAQPALRLYGWQPACLSLGRLQRAPWVDRTRLRAHGIELVRRPSGGRALFHDEEITYALVLPGAGRLGIEEAFLGITAALGEALRQLGVPVQAADGEARIPSSRALPGCSSVARPGELVDERGQKLVGSAQVRHGAALMQHGSIPSRVRWELAAQLIPGSPSGTDLSRLGRGPLEAARLAAALGRVFMIEWEERPFDFEERRRIRESAVRYEVPHPAG